MSSSTNKVLSKYSLRIEIISANFDLNHYDRISKAQLGILFQSELSYSSQVTIESSNIMVFNHTYETELSQNNTADETYGGYICDNIDSPLHDNLDSPIVISLIECPIVSSLPLYTQDLDTIPVADGYTKNIKAMSIIDMRLSSIYSSSYISVELIPTDNDLIESKLSGSGTLYLKLSIIDNHSESRAILPPLSITDSEIILNKINLYQKSISKTCHENYQRARLWLLSLRKSHPWITSHQEIKLLTQDETGQNRFVCSFLGTVYCPRDISNPRSAARYVSLLPFKQKISLTGENALFSKSWRSSATIMSTLYGDVQDHVVLLCNMLLGWGLNPWVAFGSILSTSVDYTADRKPIKKVSKKLHMWVVTTDTIRSHKKLVFWETLTGQQYDIHIDDQLKSIFHQSTSTTTATPPTDTTHTNTNTKQQQMNKSNQIKSSITNTKQPLMKSSKTTSAQPKQKHIHESSSLPQVNDPTNTTTTPLTNNSGSSIQSKHPFYEIFAIFNQHKYIINLQKYSSLQHMLLNESSNLNTNTSTVNTNINDNATLLNTEVDENQNNVQLNKNNISNPTATTTSISSSSSIIISSSTTDDYTLKTQQQQTQTNMYTQPISFDFHNKCYWSEFQLENIELLRHPGTCLHMNLNTTIFSTPTIINTTSVSSASPSTKATTTTNIATTETSKKPINIINQPISLYDHEQLIETAIQDMVSTWRYNDYNLHTYFDNKLSYALQPALLSYETERCLGSMSQSNEQDFQSMIKHAIKKGEMLRAYPTCFAHTNISTILNTLKQTFLVKSIVTGISNSDEDLSQVANTNRITRFGIRVKIFTYGDLCAVWLILASCYTT